MDVVLVIEDMWNVSRGSVIGGGSCADVDVDTGGFGDWFSERSSGSGISNVCFNRIETSSARVVASRTRFVNS